MERKGSMKLFRYHSLILLLLTVLLCASACQAELRDATVYDEAVAANEQILAYLDTHIDAPQGDDTVPGLAAWIVGEDEGHLFLYVFSASYQHIRDDIFEVFDYSEITVSLDIRRTEDGIEITGHGIPREGVFYAEDAAQLFPRVIEDRFSSLTQEELDALWDTARARVEQQYAAQYPVAPAS